MGIIKSSFIRNLEKSSHVVATQISSFTPSIPNPPPQVNEVEEGAIVLDANYQVETLETNQEIANLIDSKETDNPVDFQHEFENLMPTYDLPTTPSNPEKLPSPTPPSS